MVPPPMVVLVTVSAYWVEAPALVEVGAIDAVNLTSVTVNELLVALVSPVDDAVSVYVPPILIDRLANVAMPLESVDCVVVPLSVAVLPAGNAIVTDTLGTVLPNASFACTVTAGKMLAPATVFVGCCTNVSVSTAAAVMVNALLTTETAPLVAVRVFEPTRLMLRLLNVAIPLVFVDWMVVPLSVPVPVVNVIVTDALGTLLPNASFACTVTAGEMLTPATVVVGCCTNVSVFSAAGVMSNALLVPAVNPVDVACRV